MKKSKNIILSVLLFAFTFFAVHDYVIMDVDADTQYELCFSKHDKSQLDLPSEIHNFIHILLDTPMLEPVQVALAFAYEKPFDSKIGFTSHVHLVLQRPPLS
ncbi:hypothetical protein KJ877_06215 [bacterium]|nr:hypothetical protein [bacterium]MBU1989780.1 hypothetical protein [bacterium]